MDALGIGKTFIQLTYERFSRFIPEVNFLVMMGEGYKALVLEQLPMLTPIANLTGIQTIRPEGYLGYWRKILTFVIDLTRN